MKRIFVQLLLVIFMLFIIPLNSFSDKSYDSKNEGETLYNIKKWSFGYIPPLDPDELVQMYARQDSMYAEYMKSKKKRVLLKSLLLIQPGNYI